MENLPFHPSYSRNRVHPAHRLRRTIRHPDVLVDYPNNGMDHSLIMILDFAQWKTP